MTDDLAPSNEPAAATSPQLQGWIIGNLAVESMKPLPFALFALSALVAAPAIAADLPNPPAATPDPGVAYLDRIGWTFGAGVTAVSRKGARGEFGGDTFLGYDHRFSNDVNLSLRFDTGYAPSFAPWASSKGFDVAALDAKAVFNASSPVRPFIITSAAIARGLTFANGDPLNPLGALNGAFSGPGAAQTLGALGSGVEVDITPSVHVEFGAAVGNGVALPSGF